MLITVSDPEIVLGMYLVYIVLQIAPKVELLVSKDDLSGTSMIGGTGVRPSVEHISH